ncbi:FKBP-type peptidyl-prolyl cis-trans isomerase [Pseudoalteromonas rubra]|uniref:FKBP-type peptidyl-prolyl cis-trans isomerase n=1 Tax=Pseudoalteromonas rubra TaxID=43658 RepID=UPI001F0BA052|nr:FKBP-type peptidyl-prolyl cis-trans isomerase [Pseudoalteromonas rubra]
MTPSSVSRRINSSILALSQNNYEDALIHFFPALDKTAKRRSPSEKKVGRRIKGFISDQEGIITAIATRNIIRGIMVDNVSFPDAIYKFGRCSIAHEGELNERLKISAGNQVRIGHVWELPSSYIAGLIISVMIAPENKDERIDNNTFTVEIFGNTFKANELWGAQEKVEAIIDELFKRPEFAQQGSLHPFNWVEVDKPAEAGSKVNLDFEGFIDGAPFAGGKAKGFSLQMGEGRMVDGFEEGIIGKFAGETFDIDVVFPTNYHAENLKGQEATFKVTLNKVLYRENI